jgi:hypothetical protein
VLLLVVFIPVFFLFLPFVWFMAVSIVLVLLALVVVAPRLVSRYKIVRVESRSLVRKNTESGAE